MNYLREAVSCNFHPLKLIAKAIGILFNFIVKHNSSYIICSVVLSFLEFEAISESGLKFRIALAREIMIEFYTISSSPYTYFLILTKQLNYSIYIDLEYIAN
jgi:hypothetical protein